MVSLFFIWKPGVVILNGFGRYEASWLVRFLFLSLSRLSIAEKVIIAQSYRDYRYLRRHGLKASWVPGSGGSCYEKGGGSAALVVTRNSKIESVSCSLFEFYSVFGVPLIIAGCSGGIRSSELDSVDIRDVGYQDSKIDMYRYADSFVQPDGYGEGVAHSLVDAICSGYRIYMPKSVYLKSGLFVLLRSEGEKLPFNSGWCEISSIHSAKLERYLNVERITSQYVFHVGQLLTRLAK